MRTHKRDYVRTQAAGANRCRCCPEGHKGVFSECRLFVVGRGSGLGSSACLLVPKCSSSEQRQTSMVRRSSRGYGINIHRGSNSRDIVSPFYRHLVCQHHRWTVTQTGAAANYLAVTVDGISGITLLPSLRMTVAAPAVPWLSFPLAQPYILPFPSLNLPTAPVK